MIPQEEPPKSLADVIYENRATSDTPLFNSSPQRCESVGETPHVKEHPDFIIYEEKKCD